MESQAGAPKTPVPAAADTKLKVFVSYSRKDAADFADEMVAGLELAGFSPYLDRHDIAAGEDWEARLGGLILEADTIVFVVSPEAIASSQCVWELESAGQLGKRLLPVVWKPVQVADIPEGLRRLQFIHFDGGGPGLSRPLAQLAAALRQDVDWIREHTRLSELAAQWQARGRPDSLLLRGDTLESLHDWMSRRKPGAAEITELQHAFINASTEAEKERTSRERQQLEERERLVQQAEVSQRERDAAARRLVRRTLAFATVAMTLAIGAGGAAVWAWRNQIMAEAQRLEADKQREIAQAQSREAERQRILAETQTKEAERERANAEEQTRLAVENQSLAEAQTKRAEATSASATRAASSLVREIVAKFKNNVEVPIEIPQAILTRADALLGEITTSSGDAIELQRASADTLIELGEMLSYVGDHAGTIKATEGVERFFEKVGPENNRQAEWRLRLAEAYRQRATAFRYKSDGKAARDVSQKEVSLRADLLSEDKENPEKRRAHLRALATVVWARTATLDAEALSDTEMSLLSDFRAQLTADLIHDPQNLELVLLLSLMATAECQSHMRNGKYESAQSVAEEAVSRLTAISLRAPNDARIKIQLINAHIYLGQARLYSGNLIETRDTMSEAVALVSQLSQRGNERLFSPLLPGGAYAVLARIQTHFKRDQAAAEAYSLSRRWYQEAADKGSLAGMLQLAGIYERGEGVSQDYAKALDYYERAAAAGSSSAMANIGYFHANGQGTRQDYAKAREWYVQASEEGSAWAMNAIGDLYSNGNGVPKDHSKAHEWYKKAAGAGNSDAMTNVGDLYAGGYGVPQDYSKAREWYEKSAKAGNSTAMNSIGNLYLTGKGVPKDYTKAREWFEKAAASGSSAAMYNIGILHFNGNGVPKDYAKAREWYEKAAADGDSDGMRNIGHLHANGQGVSMDYTRAREWYEKAADAGNTNGMNDIGNLYYNGNGVPKNYTQAREWYEKAAAAGNSDGMKNIGDLHANGDDVPQDYAKTLEWYQKAADAGNSTAMNAIGDLYANGKGATQNFTKAREWYERASNSGDANAMVSLGLIYAAGLETPKDQTKALEWFDKAANTGEPQAMNDIGLRFAFHEVPAGYMYTLRSWYDALPNGAGLPLDLAVAAIWFEKAASAGHETAALTLGDLYQKGLGVPQDYAKARTWYEKATQTGDAEPLRRIGYTHFNEGNFEASEAALARAVEAEPDNAYGVLFRYLASARAGNRDTATLKVDAGALDKTQWPWAVIEMYLSNRTPAATLASPSNDNDRCEAHFYIGEWHLLKGETAAARKELQIAAETCPTDFQESHAAKAELKRLPAPAAASPRRR